MFTLRLARPLALTAVGVFVLCAASLSTGAQHTRRQADTFLNKLLAVPPPRIPDLVEPNLILSHVTAADVRGALDLTAGDVVSIDFGTSDHAGFDVFNTAASFFPAEGSSYFVMATGNTSSALMPNNSPSTSTELGGLNTTEGEDLVQIVLVLDPPSGATCLAFDFAYYSEEFPEFVGSQFNDAFIAEIGQST